MGYKPWQVIPRISLVLFYPLVFYLSRPSLRKGGPKSWEKMAIGLSLLPISPPELAGVYTLGNMVGDAGQFG
jgi:hypothetical protein